MFEPVFKHIDNVLRKEAGCTTELDYTEQTSWLLFLRYLDGLEQDKAVEAKLEGKKYAFILEEPYRYRFVLRNELSDVRDRIRAPQIAGIKFRIVRKERFSEPSLATLRLPGNRLCYGMLYGHYVILLPMYGDKTLYKHLASQTGAVDFTTEGGFPWPSGPRFLHDDAEAQSILPRASLTLLTVAETKPVTRIKRKRVSPKGHE